MKNHNGKVTDHNGKVTAEDLSPLMAKLKAFSTMYTEEDIKGILAESYSDMDTEIDFEAFLRVCCLYVSVAFYLYSFYPLSITNSFVSRSR